MEFTASEKIESPASYLSLGSSPLSVLMLDHIPAPQVSAREATSVRHYGKFCAEQGVMRPMVSNAKFSIQFLGDYSFSYL